MWGGELQPKKEGRLGVGGRVCLEETSRESSWSQFQGGKMGKLPKVGSPIEHGPSGKLRSEGKERNRLQCPFKNLYRREEKRKKKTCERATDGAGLRDVFHHGRIQRLNPGEWTEGDGSHTSRRRRWKRQMKIRCASGGRGEKRSRREAEM